LTDESLALLAFEWYFLVFLELCLDLDDWYFLAVAFAPDLQKKLRKFKIMYNKALFFDFIIF
jgi:hypothetical protein